MSGTENLIKVLLESINRKKKTSAYDTQATVLRVDNDTAWVHIPGGIDETPVRLTIAASPGDTVQVRVSGGAAWITGNSSAPPTDDHTAKQAVQRAEAAEQTVVHVEQAVNEVARQTGTNAEKIRQQAETITRIDTTAVTGVVVQYAQSDSPTTPPTRGWSDQSPAWESGKYIWQRTVTTIDGEQIISNVACIQGAKGETGAQGPQGPQGEQGAQGDKGDTGRGIRSITAEYYLSTSNTTRTGGSWSATVPVYVEGRYYWTRSKIMWDDSDTPTYTTPVLDTAITNANSAAYQALRQAGNAEDVANATKQYFWEDDAGVHIASEPEAPTATRNMLLNSLGMLFRRGANNLLALLTGTNPSVNIYDGKGDADSNVLAKFGADGARIGKSTSCNIKIEPDRVNMTAPDGNLALHASFTEVTTEGTEEKRYGVNAWQGSSHISITPYFDFGEKKYTNKSNYSASMREFNWQNDQAYIQMDDQTFAVWQKGDSGVGGGFRLMFNDGTFRNSKNMQVDKNLNVLGNILINEQKPIMYLQYTVEVDYDAGTIGTRGAAVLVESTKMEGYTYLGATIIDHRNTNLFKAELYRNESSQTLNLVAYRASTGAVSGAAVKIRMFWANNHIIG